MDRIFSTVTGWLGWTPDIALDTPLAQINLALAGRIDFLRKTNPWRTAEDVAADELEDRAPDPAGAMKKLMAFIAARRASQDKRG